MNDVVSEVVARFPEPIPTPAVMPARSDDRTSVLTECTAFLAVAPDFFSSTAARTSLAALAAFIDDECDGTITGLHFLDDTSGSVTDFRLAAPETGSDLLFMYDVPTDELPRTVHERVASSVEHVVELARLGVHAVRFPVNRVNRDDNGFRDERKDHLPIIVKILDTVAPWLSIVIDAEPHSRKPTDSRAHSADHDTLESCFVDGYRTEDAQDFSRWAVAETGQQTDTVRYNVLSEAVGSLSGSALIDTVLPSAQRARTILSAYTVLMALPGVPGVRLDAFISDGVAADAAGSVSFDRFVDSLHDRETLAGAVFAGTTERLRVRSREAAFAPWSRSRVLCGASSVISIVRGAADGPDACRPVICLHNISHEPSDPTFTPEELSVDDSSLFRDIISGDVVYPYRTTDGRFAFGLEPYESMWLKAFAP